MSQSKIILPNKKYDIILCDPPWEYHGQQDKWGAAAKFYPTMSDKEILDIPIYDIMNKRSILFIWATCPRLDMAMKLGKKNGLYYRGISFVWIKTDKAGNPFGARGVRPSITKPLVELVVAFSTVEKGRPLILGDESVQQTIFAPTREHSRKPDEVKQELYSMYTSYSKLEMFARETTPGWDAWGNEVGKFK